MKEFSPQLVTVNRNTITAFLAGQVVTLGLVCLLRPTSAGAHEDAPKVLEAETVLIRKGADSAGIQLSGAGPGGGPSISMFDGAGATRVQLMVDGTNRPLILIRNKAGQIALGIGLENDQPTVAVRSDKGTMVKLPLPQ